MKTRYVVLAVLGVLALAGAAFAVKTWFLPEASTVADESLPDQFRGATVLLAGPLLQTDPVHEVGGTVRVLQQDGNLLVRFENYSQTDGPDVYLYLTASGDQPDGDEVEGGLRLLVPGTEGGRSNLRGDFNVPIPNGTSLADYRSLAVWCDRFNVLFGYAALSSP